MKKNFLFTILFIMFVFCSFAKADEDNDEWMKHLDVYNGDGLDKPVNAIEYQKTMSALDKLKERSKKNFI